jgi:hypothetical protein
MALRGGSSCGRIHHKTYCQTGLSFRIQGRQPLACCHIRCRIWPLLYFQTHTLGTSSPLVPVPKFTKSPSLHSEERAPREVNFPCAQFLAADQQGVQTHNSRSKHQVNLLAYSLRQEPEVSVSNETVEKVGPKM